ncbi:hypothetical protein JK358_00880 [Nocardia sp. 2]|uniref:Uncharacterized protein n=1 Tax=Nocardia acididurans TaxID=2802282 RepID=A0ABS1LXA5_9NOCA|nr:hypothetical protein [Nocardia acididurans]MBL1072943.1 hypothetical protein [Nocardia acididurans]
MPFTVIAPSAGPAPMGMDKSGNQLVPADTANLKLADWVARTGYGNTTIVNHELVSGGDATVMVQCSVKLTAAWSSQWGVLRAAVMRNDTEVLKTADFVNSTSTLTLSGTQVSLLAGDRLWVRMTNTTSGPFSSSATVTSGATTYLSFDLI